MMLPDVQDSRSGRSRQHLAILVLFTLLRLAQEAERVARSCRPAHLAHSAHSVHALSLCGQADQRSDPLHLPPERLRGQTWLALRHAVSGDAARLMCQSGAEIVLQVRAVPGEPA